MVRAPPPGLLTAVLFAALCLVTACLARPLPPAPAPAAAPAPAPAAPDDAEDDGSARSERSTNLSALYGPGRPMRMFINERHLQVLPDGTVNGTHDDTDYTLLHRLSVNRHQVKIQSLATCLYLCMDSCGLLYGSETATDECVFKEHFNTETTYTTFMSLRYSNERRMQYIALNKHGRPRKLVVKAGTAVGRLLRQMRVLPLTVEEWRVAELLRRKGRHGDVPHPPPPPAPAPGAAPALGHAAAHHPLRHPGSYACPRGRDAPPRPRDDDSGRDKARCRGRRKRGKKKRRCRPGETPGAQCVAPAPPQTPAAPDRPSDRPPGTQPPRPGKCREGEGAAACRRRLRLRDERRRRKEAGPLAKQPKKKPERPKKKQRGKEADGADARSDAQAQRVVVDKAHQREITKGGKGKGRSKGVTTTLPTTTPVPTTVPAPASSASAASPFSTASTTASTETPPAPPPSVAASAPATATAAPKETPPLSLAATTPQRAAPAAASAVTKRSLATAPWGLTTPCETTDLPSATPRPPPPALEGASLVVAAPAAPAAWEGALEDSGAEAASGAGERSGAGVGPPQPDY